MEEKVVFDRIARELSSGQMAPDLWARAMSEAAGDESRARTLYIRARREQLQQPAPVAASGPPDEDDSSLDAVRARLVTGLAETGKGSFYAILGLRPDASDDAVAKAIEDARQRGENGGAELRYAIESLGHPARRADYDRRLHDQLVGGSVGRARGAQGGASYVAVDELPGGKLRIFPHGVIALVVAVLLGIFISHLMEQARIKHEAEVVLQQAEAERKAQEALRQAELLRLQQMRSQAAYQQREAERIAKEQSEALVVSRQVLELERDVLKERRLAQEKFEREERAKAQAELDAMLAKEDAQRKAAEKVRREKAYWSCLNQALNDMGRAEAQAKCEEFRDGTT